MPELPEVETMRRGVQGVVGGRIAAVTLPKCRLRPISIRPKIAQFRRQAVGLKIVAIDRLGKRVVLRLEAGRSIVFEPRMTGLLLVAEPPNRTHLRLGVELIGGAHRQLWFWDRRGLGSVRLWNDGDLAEHLNAARLGPDALAISAEGLRDQLKGSRREIKVALLDQKVVAGVGNLYAAEILHLAKLHPQSRCDRITTARWAAVHWAMQQVLQTAIRYEGSTLGDGTYRNALNKDGSYQDHHVVYQREGQRCGSCRKTEIRRIVQAQRATFFCPKCQRARR